MNAPALARSLPASAARAWRSLRPRGRAALVLLAVGLLIGGWVLVRGAGDPWPARVRLKATGDAWPLAFSPDGRTFLTSGEGGVTPWDVATGREGEPWTIPGGQSAFVGGFSPDGRSFAAAATSKDGLVAIHRVDSATGKTLASWPTPFHSVFGLSFADEGRILRALLGGAGDLKEMRSWGLETGLELPKRSLSVPTRSAVAAISADGTTLALGSWGRSVVELWDLEADRSLGSVMNPNSVAAASWGGIGLTDAGRTLAVGREDGTIEAWDVASRRQLATWKGHSPGFASAWLRFSPDGRTLASEAVLIRDSAAGQIAQEIRRRLGLHTPGDSRATEVIVLDVASGRVLARCVDSIHPSFAPDGRTIATRERDLSVKLRDLPGPSR